MAARLPKGPKTSSLVFTASSFGPVPAPPVHRIELVGEYISWARLEGNKVLPFRELSLPFGVLREFLDLESWQDKRILEFAKKNGVLGLCIHGLPVRHAPLRTNSGDWEGTPGHCPFQRYGRRFVEPLSSWRALSRAAGALVGLRYDSAATEHQKADRFRDSKWLSDQIGNLSFRFPRSGNTNGIIEAVVNSWLLCSGILPQVVLTERGTFVLEFGFDHSGPNLFGFLARQLAVAMTYQSGLAVCAACHKPFESDRTTPGRRSFCPECRRKNKPQYFAMRDYRARKKGK